MSEVIPRAEDVRPTIPNAIEAIGSRRAWRFYNPAKPVERWKIQAVLEAAKYASTVGNYCGAGCVVTYREKNPGLFEFVSDWSQAATQQAPVLIWWYYDMAAFDTQGHRIHDLMRVGALPKIQGWEWDRVARMFPLPKILPDMILHRIAAIDLGNATQNAQIAATALGLGSCLNGVGGAVRKKLGPVLGLPPTAVFCWMMTVGYVLEGWEAGGQRPRRPFEEMYFEDRFGNPFKRDPKTTELLKELKLLQRESPTPERLKEINQLTAMFGLGDDWLTDWELSPLPHQNVAGSIRNPRPTRIPMEEIKKQIVKIEPTVRREEAGVYRAKKGIEEGA